MHWSLAFAKNNEKNKYSKILLYPHAVRLAMLCVPWIDLFFLLSYYIFQHSMNFYFLRRYSISHARESRENNFHCNFLLAVLLLVCLCVCVCVVRWKVYNSHKIDFILFFYSLPKNPIKLHIFICIFYFVEFKIYASIFVLKILFWVIFVFFFR